MSTTNAEIVLVSGELHAVPLTLEGSSVLHQMFRLRWAEWRKLKESEQRKILAEAAAALEKMAADGSQAAADPTPSIPGSRRIELRSRS